MKTTVPFKIYYDSDSCYSGKLPIFEQIPTENDFKIATSQVVFNGSERILLNFQILKLSLSTSKDGEKYYLGHEKSFDEGHTSYLIGSYDSFDEAINTVKYIVKNEICIVDNFSKYLKRAIA